MRRGSPRVRRNDVHSAKPFPRLVHRLERSQHPRHELQVGNGTVLLRRVVGLVTAILREIEQPHRQPGLVEPFGHEIFHLHGHAHISVAGLELQPFLFPACHVSLLFMAARHHHVTAVQVAAAPLYRAGQHGSPVRRLQRDAGAGIRRRGEQAGYRQSPCHYHFFSHILILIINDGSLRGKDIQSLP